MSLNIINHEDNSPWQRHMNACWGCTMAFLLLQLMWDVVALVYDLTWDIPACYTVRVFSLLTIQLCAMLLWTLTTHRALTKRIVYLNVGSFTLLCTIISVLRNYVWPDLNLELILYAAEVIYGLGLLSKLIRNIRFFNFHLHQIYADTHGRSLSWMINLVWLFVLAFFFYVYFCWYDESLDFVYYPLILSCWYYIDYNITHMRETVELEQMLEEQTDAIQEEESLVKLEAKALATNDNETAERANKSLRELTKLRLEENLEDVCLKRRLYLNPDLTVNDLAVELKTNRTYISQYFSEHHTTFLKYINDLRAEYAMYQLKNTEDKIPTVANNSGFHHIDTFRRAFISRYNIEPKEVIRPTSEVKGEEDDF